MRARVTFLAGLFAAFTLVIAGLMVSLPDVAHAEEGYVGVAGDSITWGFGASDPERTDYAALTGIPAWGVGGGCITRHPLCTDELYVLRWWPEALDAMRPEDRPSLVVMMLGTNDYPNSSVRQIKDAMRKLVRISRARGVRVVFGTITPAPAGSFWNVGPTEHGKATRLAVNEWIRAHASLHGPEYARALQCRGRDLCERFINPELGDVHFNDAGHAVMAKVLMRWLADKT